MPEEYVPRRVRQRQSLGISVEEIADEWGVSVEIVRSFESRDDSGASEAGAAWDAALGRVLRAREEATKDEAEAAAEDSTERDADPDPATVPSAETEPGDEALDEDDDPEEPDDEGDDEEDE